MKRTTPGPERRAKAHKFSAAAVALLLAAHAATAQTVTVAFSYDGNGSRTARTVTVTESHGGGAPAEPDTQGGPTARRLATDRGGDETAAMTTPSDDATAIAAYPNPTRGRIRVTAGAPGTVVRVEVRSMTGATLLRDDRFVSGSELELPRTATGPLLLTVYAGPYTESLVIIRE